MAWIEIPDDAADRVGLSGVGMLLLATSWCEGHTNWGRGFVPLHVLEQWDDGWQAIASVLVQEGFWARATSREVAGFQFARWGEEPPAGASTFDASALQPGEYNPETGDYNPNTEQ